MFEYFLNKIQNNDMRFRLPPLRFGGTKTENFFLHFLIFLRAIFSFKRKRKFICFVFLLIREKRKRSNSNRKKQKFFPPDSLPFCPFAYSLASRARRRGFLKKKTKELRLTRPTHSRATDISSLYFCCLIVLNLLSLY